MTSIEFAEGFLRGVGIFAALLAVAVVLVVILRYIFDRYSLHGCRALNASEPVDASKKPTTHKHKWWRTHKCWHTHKWEPTLDGEGKANAWECYCPGCGEYIYWSFNPAMRSIPRWCPGKYPLRGADWRPQEHEHDHELKRIMLDELENKLKPMEEARQAIRDRLKELSATPASKMDISPAEKQVLIDDCRNRLNTLDREIEAKRRIWR